MDAQHRRPRAARLPASRERRRRALLRAARRHDRDRVRRDPVTGPGDRHVDPGRVRPLVVRHLHDRGDELSGSSSRPERRARHRHRPARRERRSRRSRVLRARRVRRVDGPRHRGVVDGHRRRRALHAAIPRPDDRRRSGRLHRRHVERRHRLVARRPVGVLRDPRRAGAPVDGVAAPTRDLAHRGRRACSTRPTNGSTSASARPGPKPGS